MKDTKTTNNAAQEANMAKAMKMHYGTKDSQEDIFGALSDIMEILREAGLTQRAMIATLRDIDTVRKQLEADFYNELK